MYSSFNFNLDADYSRFINEYRLTLVQKGVFDKTLTDINAFVLSNAHLKKDSQFSFSVYDEAIITRTSKNGVYNIVIDSDGDIMLSFSGYKEHGWRKFIDVADFIPSKLLSKFS